MIIIINNSTTPDLTVADKKMAWIIDMATAKDAQIGSAILTWH